tara:strand:+ start:133 stop:336 length:204 start_codon:yes stop_codon:yes gene_type:complete
MARFKVVNGVKINLTPEEETIRDQEEAQAAINKQAEIDAAAKKAADKASADAKLKALGLTDDEIAAL